MMNRTKKSRFDAGVKCTVNDLIDAPSQVNASCSLYYGRPYESCTKMLGNSKSDSNIWIRAVSCLRDKAL